MKNKWGKKKLRWQKLRQMITLINVRFNFTNIWCWLSNPFLVTYLQLLLKYSYLQRNLVINEKKKKKGSNFKEIWSFTTEQLTVFKMLPIFSLSPYFTFVMFSFFNWTYQRTTLQIHPFTSFTIFWPLFCWTFCSTF